MTAPSAAANLASICSTAHEARLLTIAQPSFFEPTYHCAQVIERGVKRHCEGITGHYDQSAEHSAIPIHLPLLRRRAIVCVLPLTREGCRDFRRGDGSERAVGRHDTLQTDFAFLPV